MVRLVTRAELVLDCEVLLAALALITPVETLLHPYQHNSLNGSVVVSSNGFLNPIRVRHVAPTCSASHQTLSTAHSKSTGVAWNLDTGFDSLLQVYVAPCNLDAHRGHH